MSGADGMVAGAGGGTGGGTGGGACVCRFACEAMGTRFECCVADDGRPAREMNAVGEAALREVCLLDAALSRFRRDSLVSELGRRALGDPMRVDAEMLALFDEALAVWRDSEGLFDPALGEVADALRGATARRTPKVAKVVLAGPPYSVDTSSGTISMLRRAALDLGGIAKGHAIDLAIRVLRDAGVSIALLHGGTSAVGALGAPPGRAGWRIDVAVPESMDAESIATACRSSGRFVPRGASPDGRRAGFTVELRDECLAVSAPHGRMDRGGHHIVDPRSGRSAACAALAAVVGPACRTCDAWTKPMLIGRRRPSGLPIQYDAWVGGDAA